MLFFPFLFFLHPEGSEIVGHELQEPYVPPWEGVWSLKEHRSERGATIKY